MKKIAVILGAGASGDAWNETGPPHSPEWRPPLAKELFGQRQVFWEILKGYPGAYVLATDLGELVRGGAVSMESKLREYAEHKDKRIREHFKQVPPYLRDLIIAVVQNYTGYPMPGTHLRFVMNLLAAELQVLFIDLNYDDYLETGLALFDQRLIIRGMEDYVAADRQTLVCKAHGSVLWGTPMGAPQQNFWEGLSRFDPLAGRVEILRQTSRNHTTDWRDEQGRPLYPVLTAPLAGKGHMDLVCPRGHLQAVQTFLRDCDTYIFVGTSAQDEDLLEFLRQSVRSVRTLHCVSDSEGTAEEAYVRLVRACPMFTIGEGRLFFGGGFRSYVGSREFQGLLRG